MYDRSNSDHDTTLSSLLLVQIPGGVVSMVPQ